MISPNIVWFKVRMNWSRESVRVKVEAVRYVILGTVPKWTKEAIGMFNFCRVKIKSGCIKPTIPLTSLGLLFQVRLAMTWSTLPE